MTDAAVEILREIRDELKVTRADLAGRIDETNARIDETNTRLGRVERRQIDAELRISTELVAVAGAVRDLRDVLLEDRKLRDQVSDHERRLAALERRPSEH